jgi:hypothetical protein
MWRALFAAVAVAASLEAQGTPARRPSLRDIDWGSRSYPFAEVSRVPASMRWLPVGATMRQIALTRGVFEFEQPGCRNPGGYCPLVTYEFAEYGKISGIRTEVAAVVLSFSPNAEVGWQYVYLYTLDGQDPKLLGWLEAGYRFSSGLKGLAIEGGSLVLDLYDPSRQMGQSCSLGFVRLRFRWKNEGFRQEGTPVPGHVPLEDCRAVQNPVLKKRK